MAATHRTLWYEVGMSLTGCFVLGAIYAGLMYGGVTSNYDMDFCELAYYASWWTTIVIVVIAAMLSLHNYILGKGYQYQ